MRGVPCYAVGNAATDGFPTTDLMHISTEFLPIGRLNRLGFWLRHLLVLPLALALCITLSQRLGGPWDLLPAVGTLMFLVSVWGRRLHDRGRSAWCLFGAIVPILGALLLLIECGLRGSRTPAIENRPGVDYKAV
jgi:uncharacterized membrane protein YhaH (DUF805 family)